MQLLTYLWRKYPKKEPGLLLTKEQNNSRCTNYIKSQVDNAEKTYWSKKCDERAMILSITNLSMHLSWLKFSASFFQRLFPLRWSQCHLFYPIPSTPTLQFMSTIVVLNNGWYLNEESFKSISNVMLWSFSVQYQVKNLRKKWSMHMLVQGWKQYFVG